MSHPNRIYNGDFAQDLDGWTANGAAQWVSNVGNNELGAAYVSSSGDYIERQFTIGVGRDYMIQIAVKSVSGSGSMDLTILRDNGDTLYSTTLTVTNSWDLQPDARVGLPWGTHTLRLSYNNVAAYIDDISIAFVPMTRAELAAAVHERLDVLATDASLSTTASGSDTEGDYTDAVDAGMRKVGALDPAGRTDVRYLDVDMIDGCLEEVELGMLHRLHRYYSTKTDYAIGPRDEKLSQISAAIERLIGIAVGGRSAASGRAVKQRRLIHKGHQ